MTVLVTVGVLIWAIVRLFVSVLDPRMAPILGVFCWGALFLLFDWLAGQKLKELGVEDGDKLLVKKGY